MTGKTILHYKILEKLGQGGMGVVYKAEDVKLNRLVALKFLHPYLIGQPRTRERMKREARAAASLNHPNICTIHEYHETEDAAFIVMEYIEGETLRQMIDRNGPLPQEKATAILKQIVEALAVAHQSGIIHRDIKPDNIMITQTGQVKVTDFGLAKVKDAPTITKTKSPMGTVSYMSPELVQGEDVDHRTDLWSLGVVLFEMLTGEMPFKGDSDVAIMYSIIGDRPAKLTKFDSKISNSLQYICTTLLEKNPALRYQRAEDVLNDLQRNVKASKTKLTLRKVRKNYQLFSIAIALLLVISHFANYYYQTRINIPAWLKGNAKPVRLTNETGFERGKISPDCKFLVFNKENDENLYIRDLTNEKTEIIKDSIAGSFASPTWSMNSKQIAYLTNRHQTISVFDVKNHRSDVIFRTNTGYMLNLDWSSDGRKFVTSLDYVQEGKNRLSLLIIDSDGSGSKTLLEREFPLGASHPVWHPNCQQIIFYDLDLHKRKKEIRSIDVQTGILSPPLHSLKYTVSVWFNAGIRCSPDGKYLVFPEEINNSIELAALSVNSSCIKTKGNLISLTNFAGLGEPFWPSFSKDGKSLCFGLETGSQIIYIQSIDATNARAGEKSSLVSTFTNRVNFDANWSPDGQRISFLSIKGPKISGATSKPEIYIWDKQSEKPVKIDGPKFFFQKLDFHPDNHSLTFTYDRALWKMTPPDTFLTKLFPFDTSDDNVMIYSYDWGESPNELFAIIFHSVKEINKGQLVRINLETKQVKTLLKDVNVVYAGVRYSPKSKLLALRNYDTEDHTSLKIYIINADNGTIKSIGSHSIVVPQGQISWTADGKHVLYGSWDKDVLNFYHYLVSLDGKKTLISGPAFSGSKIAKYPGQISPQGDEYLFTTASGGADMWMIGER